MSLMVVVATYVALVVFSTYLFVAIRRDQVPSVEASELIGWHRFAWFAALVLMAIPVVPNVIGLVFGGLGSSPDGIESVYWFNVAMNGPVLMLIPCLVLAFWRQRSAALLLVVVAVAAPVAVWIQSLLPLPESVDPTDQLLFYTPFLLIAGFSIPALVVAVLLWGSARGPSPKQSQVRDDVPIDPVTRPTDTW